MLQNHSNLVSMGKIVNVFGIQGFVKVKIGTSLDNLKKYKKLHILIDNNVQTLEVEKYSAAKDDVVNIKFSGIEDRDKALTLRGAIIAVSRSDFPELAKDEYYWTDLIGLKVVNLQQQLLGTVESLIEAGTTSVLVIQGEKKHLIPFVANYITSVNMQDKCITVDWGLDY